MKKAETNSINLMSLYVVFIRALYQIHQNNHWKSKGENFYGNHLLFERLYDSAQEMADNAAERTIGLFGDLDIRPETIAEITEKFDAGNYDNNPVTSSLKAEKAFQTLSKLIYNQLDKSDALTLGLDDLIMENAGKSEVHCYLLQQSLREKEEN